MATPLATYTYSVSFRRACARFIEQRNLKEQIGTYKEVGGQWKEGLRFLDHGSIRISEECVEKTSAEVQDCISELG